MTEIQNEATLEAQVNKCYNKYFPKFNRTQLTHQKQFKLKLGHHDITIDSEKQFETKRGKLDILVSYQEKNLAVIELKRKKLELTEDDRDQGISYARLLTPMPPFVIVSNGDKSLFYETYTGNEIQCTSIEEEMIVSIFKQTLEMSSQSKDEAIRLLLGNNADLWSQVAMDITKYNLAHQVGNLEEIAKPICPEYLINREKLNDILSSINNREKLIAIVGPPMSGKTNLMYELAYNNNDEFIPLYIDVLSCAEGILQRIANEFTRKTFISTSKEDVREWFINNLLLKNNDNFPRCVLILDNYNHDINGEIYKDIQEILQYLDTGHFSLVLSIEENIHNKMIKQTGRSSSTMYGHLVKPLYLEALNQKEISDFESNVLRAKGYIFHPGAHLNIELTNPRMMKSFLATNTTSTDKLTTGFELLHSVVNCSILESAIERHLTDHQLKNDLIQFAKCVIHDSYEPKLSTTYIRGYTRCSYAEEQLGQERLNRLKEFGFITYLEDQNYELLLITKVPELLSSVASIVLAKEFSDLGQLLIRSTKFHYEDLVAAFSIKIISSQDEKKLPLIIHELKKASPFLEVEEIKYGTPLVEKNGLAIYLAKTIAETPVGALKNTLPWLVISRLLHDDYIQQYSLDFFLQLVYQVGSYPNILLDPNISRRMEGFCFKGYPTAMYISRSVGVIEPITYALQRAFLRLPNKMSKLADKAIKRGDFHFAYRLLTAINNLVSINDVRVSKVRQEVFVKLHEFTNGGVHSK